MSIKIMKPPSKKEHYILDKICKYDYLTSSNMAKIIPDSSNRYKLLKNLETKGYISKHTIGPKNNIWFFSEYGKEFASLEFPNIQYNFSIEELEEQSTPHTSGLIDIELKFEERKKESSSLLDYFCEKEITHIFDKNRNEIKEYSSTFFRIPDALFKMHVEKLNKTFNFVVELELHMKSKKRYFNIFHFYREYTSVNRVYWVCSDDSMKNRLVSYFMSLYKRDKSELDLTISGNTERLERSAELHYFITQKELMKNGFNESKKLIEYLD
jgi:hypothetical protein